MWFCHCIKAFAKALSLKDMQPEGYLHEIVLQQTYALAIITS
jgi:hypothetical protein